MNHPVNLSKSRRPVSRPNEESQANAFWQKSQVFEKANSLRKGKTFLLLDGPPYANGSAHLGHGYNKLLKDLVVKSRWLLGEKVSFSPSWDCHGLPLELAVEKRLGRLSEEELVAECGKLAERSVELQAASFRSLGVFSDWSHPDLTLSEEMKRASWKTLGELFSKGLLEYSKKPVHYCPACASSLAEAELEQSELKKHSLYFKVRLAGSENASILVWTTTPWTIPMNQAFAYSESFEYEKWSDGFESLYSQKPELKVEELLLKSGFRKVGTAQGGFFDGLFAESPLNRSKSPLLPADFVESGKTGFVHLAAAHGSDDYELCSLFGIPPDTLLDERGRFSASSDSALREFDGKNLSEASTLALELLGDSVLSHSESLSEQNVCWRHKKPTYMHATWQVLLNLEADGFHVKKKAFDLLEASPLLESDKKRLNSMLSGRSHWCLSRQRRWGTKMNLLVDSETNALSPLSAEALNLLSEGRYDEAERFVSECPGLKVVSDVLDVWFDSGNYANFKTSFGKLNSPNLVLEGKDQFRGWFQSLLILSVAASEKLPYERLYCHGFVLDESKMKLSKSEGASPLDYYADKLGGDALRLWAALQERGCDAVFSEHKMDEVKKIYARLRLSLRFMTTNLYDYPKDEHEKEFALLSERPEFDLHRFVFFELAQAYEKIAEAFEAFSFKTGLDILYRLCDKLLSGFYFDFLKNSLYLRSPLSAERRAAQAGMHEALLLLLDLVKTYCPYAAEEFRLDYFNDGESCFLHYEFPEAAERLLKDPPESDWRMAMNLKNEVQGFLEPFRKNGSLGAGSEAKVSLSCGKAEFEALSSLSEAVDMRSLLGVGAFLLLSSSDRSLSFTSFLEDPTLSKCPRCREFHSISHFKNEVCLDCSKDLPFAS